MAESIKLPKDFVDFFTLLNNHRVRYIVVGAWAVGLHGRPRYTKDVDILVSKDSDNAIRIMKALSDFGFGSVGLSKEDFQKENYIIQLGYEPNRIDILTGIDGVNFEQAEKRAENRTTQGVSLSILSIEDLIAAKKSASRPQDLADVEQLERIIKAKSSSK